MQMKQQQLNVELGDKESEGTYANMVLIAHSPHEMVLDFARVVPGVKKTKVYSRIIMTPAHAKLLHRALEENIKKYEKQHGEIKLPGSPEKSIGFQAGRDEQ